MSDTAQGRGPAGIPQGFVTGDEYLRLPRPTSSDERLAALPPECWTALEFRKAALEFARTCGLEWRLLERDQPLPRLTDIGRFSYSSEYAAIPGRLAEGDRLVVSAALQDDRVVAYAIGVAGSTQEIEILDVNTALRRRAGVRRELIVGGEQFSVGVAHVLITLLIDRLGSPLDVNAQEVSHYIFKSLGFRHREGTSNGRLLRLL